MKIKILFDGTSMRKNPSGVGNVTFNLINELSKYKELFFIVYTRKGVNKLNNLGLKRDNIIFHETNFEFSHFGLNRFLFEQIELPKIVKKYKPNIVHLTNSFGYPLLINKLKNNLKVLVTLHDLIPLTQYCELMNKFEKLLYKLSITKSLLNADKIVTISQFTAKDLTKYFPYIDKNKIKIIPNGIESINIPINIEKIWSNIVNKYQINKGIIFYLGGFAPRKNVLRLIKAYHLLIKSKKINYQLVLSGRFSKIKDIINNINQIKHYINQNNLEKHIKIIDYLNQNEKIVFLAKAKFFAYISLYEGFGLPVLEALSLGTPVLTSKNSAMEEIAEKYAFYANPEDVNNIANNIIELIKNYPKIKQMAELAKVKLIPKFNWQNSGKMYYNLYKDL
jgi:glycosyltransferase involved in cell wall biosynthesis